jgi:AcrR family transcriptional regulator
VNERLSLRERKKRATRLLLMDTALALFEERGFENVSVAEIAEVAEVSKATVFNYFPAKEDLVLAGAKEHLDEAARVVRSRPVGQTPHGALRHYHMEMLRNREPLTGLSDHPVVLRVHRVIRRSPDLALKAMDLRRHSAELVARALMEEGSPELTARLVAAQLMHAQHILSHMNVHRINAGESPEEIYPDAVAAAEHAFQLLEHGIGDFMRREAGAAVTPDSAFHEGPRHDLVGAHEAVERPLGEAADDMCEKLVDPRRR